ncbi:uncharacterized protein KY384_008003 [Bacidia gigantensis]|uniref:uncharacterized protein n=1 Tax=Bacidia gigantensis TaxID=2732470 RepID=UPI001D050410|nr:uncharacterized protein KY384_008003 [Bacidia gigantensis]KAG8527259.1 hypothetical protein KY384_008003 [Bacidia gigantensis]
MGGIMSTGDNELMRFIVYAPDSEMDKGAKEDQRDNFIVSVAGKDFSGSDSEATISDESLPDTNNEYQDLEGAASALLGLKGQGTSTGNAGAQTASMSASGIRSLPQGWELDFTDTTYLQGAEYNKLESFWMSVEDLAIQQFSSTAPPRNNLALKADHLQLQLSSSGPISWMWVLDFAVSMLGAVRDQFGVLFSAEAYSNHFDLPPLSAKLSIV